MKYIQNPAYLLGRTLRRRKNSVGSRSRVPPGRLSLGCSPSPPPCSSPTDLLLEHKYIRLYDYISNSTTISWTIQPHVELRDYTRNYSTTLRITQPHLELHNHTMNYSTTPTTTKPHDGLNNHTVNYSTTLRTTQPHHVLFNHT